MIFKTCCRVCDGSRWRWWPSWERIAILFPCTKWVNKARGINQVDQRCPYYHYGLFSRCNGRQGLFDSRLSGFLGEMDGDVDGSAPLRRYVIGCHSTVRSHHSVIVFFSDKPEAPQRRSILFSTWD